MRERVKVFTYISGTGATVIESALEEQLNRWLEAVDGDVVRVTQSESERLKVGQHVTVCVWYVPRGP
jgi:adenylylsulfate kinase-like enzyme